VRSGQDTANVFYQFGQRLFPAKQFRRAILNYDAALALEPHHPEAQANCGSRVTKRARSN